MVLECLTNEEPLELFFVASVRISLKPSEQTLALRFCELMVWSEPHRAVEAGAPTNLAW